MMEAKDWLSFFIGVIVAAMGVLPILKTKFNIGPEIFKLGFLQISIFAYLIAAVGFYLLINSFIEITNSNPIGWFSLLFAALIIATGIMQVLFKFGVGPSFFELKFIEDIIYRIIFMIEGLFLVIATFAMEM